MKTFFKAAAQIIKLTLFILLLLVLPAVVFTLTTSKLPVLGGIQSFVVLTGSMSPNYPPGAIIYTKPQNTYKIGDVISFHEGDVTVTHRVISINPEGYLTKGDANNVTDSKIVPSSQIIGKSVFSVLNAGKLILFIKTPAGFLTLLILPTLLFIGSQLMNIKKEIEKELKKKLMKEFKNNQMSFP